MTDVSVTRRMVETAGKGLRGRDGERSAKVPCTITGTNSLTMTPIAPHEAVGNGSGQTFFGRAAATNTGGMDLVIVGLNDGDPRQIRLPGGTQTVPAGSVTSGEIIEVALLGTALFELLTPAVSTRPSALIPTTISGTNALTMTPVAPHALSGIGANQLFLGTAAATNTAAMSIVIPGFNDGDPRQLRLPGGTEQVPAGAIVSGERLLVAFLGTGLFELVAPAVASAETSGALVRLSQSGGDGNDWVLTVDSGAASPSALFMFKIEQEQGEGGISVEIEGFTDGDPRQLRTPDGTSQIAPGTWSVDDTIFFSMNDLGLHELVLVANQDSPTGGGLSTYEKIALRGAGQNAAALRIALMGS